MKNPFTLGSPMGPLASDLPPGFGVFGDCVRNVVMNIPPAFFQEHANKQQTGESALFKVLSTAFNGVSAVHCYCHLGVVIVESVDLAKRPVACILRYQGVKHRLEIGATLSGAMAHDYTIVALSEGPEDIFPSLQAWDDSGSLELVNRNGRLWEIKAPVRLLDELLGIGELDVELNGDFAEVHFYRQAGSMWFANAPRSLTSAQLEAAISDSTTGISVITASVSNGKGGVVLAGDMANALEELTTSTSPAFEGRSVVWGLGMEVPHAIRFTGVSCEALLRANPPEANLGLSGHRWDDAGAVVAYVSKAASNEVIVASFHNGNSITVGDHVAAVSAYQGTSAGGTPPQAAGGATRLQAGAPTRVDYGDFLEPAHAKSLFECDGRSELFTTPTVFPFAPAKRQERQHLVGLMCHTLGRIAAGSFVAGSETHDLHPELMRTTRYTIDDMDTGGPLEKFPQANREGQVVCMKKDCLVQAKDLKEAGASHVCLLNMANETRPGGGYDTGARAQEEDIMRRTTLSVALDGRVRTYLPRSGRVTRDSLSPAPGYPWDCDALFTTDVEIFRNPSINGFTTRRPVSCSVISTASIQNPDLKAGTLANEADADLIFKRINVMFRAAIKHGVTDLILSALGCGAFRNPPRDVVQLFANAVYRYRSHFRTVVFSILGDNFDTFHQGLQDVMSKPALPMAVNPGAESLRRKCKGGAKCTLKEQAVHAAQFWHEQPCPDGIACPLRELDTPDARRHNNAFTHPTITRCRDGGLCKNYGDAHRSQYTHPAMCRNGHRCHLLDDPVHAMSFTHIQPVCTYGPFCSKVLDPQHWKEFTHGPVSAKPVTSDTKCSLLDPAVPGLHLCPFGAVCDMLNEFFTNSKPSQAVQEHMSLFTHNYVEPCRYGDECTSRDDEHYVLYSHPGGRQVRHPCKFGAGCRSKNSHHMAKFRHPATHVPYAKLDSRVWAANYTENARRLAALQEGPAKLIHKDNLATITKLVGTLRPTHRCSKEVFASVLDHGYFMSHEHMGRLDQPATVAMEALNNPELDALVATGDATASEQATMRSFVSHRIKAGIMKVFDQREEAKVTRELTNLSSRVRDRCVKKSLEEYSDRIVQASKSLHGNRTGIDYKVDAIMETNDTVFSILGPNSFHRYGEVCVVFKPTVLAHPATFSSILAATFWHTHNNAKMAEHGHGHLAIPEAVDDRKDYYYDHTQHMSSDTARRTLAAELCFSLMKHKDLDLTKPMASDDLTAEMMRHMVHNKDMCNAHHMIECHLPSRVSIDHVEAVYIAKGTYDGLPDSAKRTLTRLKEARGTGDITVLLSSSTDQKSVMKMMGSSFATDPTPRELSMHITHEDGPVPVPLDLSTSKPTSSLSFTLTGNATAVIRLEPVNRKLPLTITISPTQETIIATETNKQVTGHFTSPVDLDLERRFYVEWSNVSGAVTMLRYGASYMYHKPILNYVLDAKGYAGVKFKHVSFANDSVNRGLSIGHIQLGAARPSPVECPAEIIELVREKVGETPTIKPARTPARPKPGNGRQTKDTRPWCHQPHLCIKKRDKKHCNEYRHICGFGRGCTITNPAHHEQYAHPDLPLCTHTHACSNMKDIRHRLTYDHGLKDLKNASRTLGSIPTIKCKNGASCTRPNCTFLHCDPADDPGYAIHPEFDDTEAPRVTPEPATPQTPIKKVKQGVLGRLFGKSTTQREAEAEADPSSRRTTPGYPSDDHGKRSKPATARSPPTRRPAANLATEALSRLDLRPAGFSPGDRDQYIVFVLDATGSMSGLIKAAAENIIEMARLLSAKYSKMADSVGYEYDVAVNFAVVAYRDINDHPSPVECIDFTKDLSKVASFTRGLQATGGGDYPEDICTGLDAAMKLSFGERGARTVMIWGDAPAHWISTSRLCGGGGDSWPEHDQNGTPWAQRFDAVLAHSKRLKIRYQMFDLRPSQDTFREMRVLFNRKLGSGKAEVNAVGSDMSAFLDKATAGAEKSYAAALDAMA